MARDAESRENGNAFTHFFDRIDRALLPAFGPPPVIADDSAPEPTDEKPCPICGHPMFEHVIDHSTANTVLICPTDERLPETDVEGPLNELGMPATGKRAAKFADRDAAR